MDNILAFINKVSFVNEILIACLIFMSQLVKHKNYLVRVVLGIITADIIGYFISTLEPSHNWVIASIRYSILFFAIAVPFIMFCSPLAIQDAIYCAICAYATQHFASAIYIMLRYPDYNRSWITHNYLIIYICSYILFYFIFAKNLSVDGRYNVSMKKTTSSVLIILPFVLILSIIAKYYFMMDTKKLFILCQIYAMICCFFVLWVQVSQKKSMQLQHEVQLLQYLGRQREIQYKSSKDNIDLINRKCHDLKHQLAAFRNFEGDKKKEIFLKEIENAVQFYEISVNTGNEALDTVLMEKSLYCKAHQITWTCVADGKQLDFIDIIDLYTIFGNALDNAIECVNQLDNPKKRIISLKVYTKDSLLMIQVENFYENEIIFMDGLPTTTKEEKDYHGYGIKSIKFNVEKYGGYINVNAKNNIFTLQILLPIPRTLERIS